MDISKAMKSLYLQLFNYFLLLSYNSVVGFVTPNAAAGQPIIRLTFRDTDPRYCTLPSKAIRTTLFQASSSTSESDASSQEDDSSSLLPVQVLDKILSRLTSGFPLFVLSAAILGLVRPTTLKWVNQGNLITIMLASVMCGTGLTLRKQDFTQVFKDNFESVPLGVLCQFVIMPLASLVVGRTLLLPTNSAVAAAATTASATTKLLTIETRQALFLGLCLVGSSPGGTASNLVSLIANANVALSVILTACSTMMAVFMTPLLVQLLVGSQIHVSGMALIEATARVVLLPVLLGMVINSTIPAVAQAVARFTPFASVILVSLICGGVVAQNAAALLSGGTTTALTVGSVLLLHSIGFTAGYFVPKFLLDRSIPKKRDVERTARTISIEVGMQNSALAVVLARSIGAPALACLPGALSATAHSCLGSILAAFWQRSKTDEKNGEDNEYDDDGDDDEYWL